MKHSKHHDNAPNAGPQLMPVRFNYADPQAASVCVAGTFNQWKPEAKVLHPAGGGRWMKDTALAPGSYEYCFVVDGKWIPDPLAVETVSNPYGGRNSVLRVFSSPDAGHLENAEFEPMIDSLK